MYRVTYDELGAVEARGIPGQRLDIAPQAEMVLARFASHPVASAVASDVITMPQVLALRRMLPGSLRDVRLVPACAAPSA
ncbi:hypothetical protein [Mesorhizobium sp. M0323]|uniref:hypothetical protein n=1 Tax=Mesorhizobium sp. M0323 TaxID=2956938 RepID=UPI00333908FC